MNKFSVVKQYFGLVFSVLAALMCFSLFSIRQLNTSLKTIQEVHVSAMQQLVEIRVLYRDIGFRMAGYTNGLYPAVGSKIRVEEWREQIAAAWPRYLQLLRKHQVADEKAEIIAKLTASVRATAGFFYALETAFNADSVPDVRRLIERDWLEIQASILSPIQELLKAHSRSVEQEYLAAQRLDEVFFWGCIGAFAAGIALLALGYRKVLHFLRKYDAQLQANLSASRLANLGEMAGGVAHEINNPLAIIHLNASLLADLLAEPGFDPKKAGALAAKISMTVDRISKITKSLLTFARDGSHDPMVSCTLWELVGETMELCRARFDSHQITLRIAPGLGEIPLQCRPVQLSQVLLNLLNNAHDAVEGLEERWVEIDGRIGDGTVDIYVTDSGKGISDEIRDKILQPFFTTKGVGRGTGLGLSLSNAIVNAHGGKLWIDTRHKNTRFVVSLPRAGEQVATKVA